VSNVKSDGPLRVVLFKNQDFYPRTIVLVKMNSQKYKISFIIDSDRGPDNMQILASEKYTYRVRSNSRDRLMTVVTIIIQYNK
jgi:hypothetical protein